MKPTSILAAALLLSLVPRPALAHCDSVDGPVAVDAKKAIAAGDPTPILKWIAAKDEPEIRAAFERTVRVGKLSPEAKEMAETWFLETLVRVHRASEGFGFTGLKPAGTTDPALTMADKALESGSVEGMAKAFSAHMGKEMQRRFDAAVEAKKHAGESVEKGRAYVSSYVVFLHYVENLHEALAKGPAGHGGSAGAAHEH